MNHRLDPLWKIAAVGSLAYFLSATSHSAKLTNLDIAKLGYQSNLSIISESLDRSIVSEIEKSLSKISFRIDDRWQKSDLEGSSTGERLYVYDAKDFTMQLAVNSNRSIVVASYIGPTYETNNHRVVIMDSSSDGFGLRKKYDRFLEKNEKGETVFNLNEKSTNEEQKIANRRYDSILKKVSENF
jgi:hypothetical protein